jgi:ABC-type antimicrobial peptide transport system permease subunit
VDKDYKNKNVRSNLARPWLFESLIFFFVLWQESFRLSSRTSHKILPISPTLQKYYYYNFGDFVNGYIIAFIIDGIINLTLLKTAISYNISSLQITKRKNAFLATVFSIAVVVIFELTQSTATTSDVNDIPAGIFGALLYYLIRFFALSRTSEYDNK